jgi:hypothetical protein
MSDENTAPVDAREFADWWRETGERELCQLLYWVWDPIDLNQEFPDAADEYDGYAIEIATALASGMPVPTLAESLATIERDRMGLGQRSLDAIADRLQTWYARSRDRARAVTSAGGASAYRQID